MSENENAGTIPRFSEMFRFADDSDLNEHLRELRAEAFAYGFNLDLGIYPDGIPPSEKVIDKSTARAETSAGNGFTSFSQNIISGMCEAVKRCAPRAW